MNWQSFVTLGILLRLYKKISGHLSNAIEIQLETMELTYGIRWYNLYIHYSKAYIVRFASHREYVRYFLCHGK